MLFLVVVTIYTYKYGSLAVNTLYLNNTIDCSACLLANLQLVFNKSRK